MIERGFPYLLIFAAIALSVFFAYTTTLRTTTALEGTMLQIIVLLAGLSGSFIVGRQSASEAAKEIIKPHARSAFRRLVSLFKSLSRVATIIDNSRNSDEKQNAVLDMLEGIVVEQIATADDALEDWRDVVPEDVEEIRQKLIVNDETN
ncbi:MAG: hypothetical protein WD037_03040 [Balneolales bacterium]